MNHRKAKTYRILPRRLEIQVEVAPQLLDLVCLDHAVDGCVCILHLALLAHVIPLDDLVSVHMTLTLEVADDPFVEVEAPMGQGVSELSFGFALPDEKLG